MNMDLFSVDRAKCRRRDMSIDWARRMSQTPLGAPCAVVERRVAPTGLISLRWVAFYKHAAPTALNTAPPSRKLGEPAFALNEF